MAAHGEDALVAVATNFKPVMDELKPTFEAGSEHTITIAAGSTGKLYAQIKNGAPFDVFLSADQTHPALLVSEGRAAPASMFTYGIGRIVLWSPTETDLSAERLERGNFRFLALANPKLAPYGKAAEQVLQGLDVYDALKDHLVFGENIGQTFAFIQTGNAELGFVAQSQVLSRPENKRGQIWLVPEALYNPIRQDAVLLGRGQDNQAAADFMDFLRSEPARAIIQRHGYDTP